MPTYLLYLDLSRSIYIYLFFSKSICISISNISIYVSISISIPISIPISISMSISISISIYLSFYLSTYVSIYLCIYLSIYQSINLSIYPSTIHIINLSVYLSIPRLCIQWMGTSFRGNCVCIWGTKLIGTKKITIKRLEDNKGWQTHH